MTSSSRLAYDSQVPVPSGDPLHSAAKRFYASYPMMQPYVGDRFREATTKLLLIGESHYLPHDSSQHLSPEDWYGGTSATLRAAEKIWISTAQIVRGAVAAKFANKAHWIWKNAFETINAAGPKYADYASVAGDVAFYNFFLRPAKRGLSLECRPEDEALANEAFSLHYENLQPSCVIFLSVLARRHFRATPGVKVIATTHPSSAWWNRTARTRGNRSGRQILHDYVATTRWP